MEKALINRWIAEMRAELNDIQKFWSESMIDNRYGGFLPGMNTIRQVDEKGPKGIVLNARILWAFSALALHHNPACHMLADRAFKFINDYFRDSKHGGYYWSVTFDGQPWQTRKQVYAQAFVLYALVEYYFLTHDAVVLSQALELFELMEQRGLDPVTGGYTEAFSQEWSPLTDWRLSNKDLNEPLSLNTHLHVLEAYTSLCRISPEKPVINAIGRLHRLFEAHFLKSDGHLNLFFNLNWQPVGNLISFGHDIETTWLLQESIEVLSAFEKPVIITDWIRHAGRVFLNEALLPDGSARYETDPLTGHDDFDRHWWVQAEGMVGLLNAYGNERDPLLLKAALQLWKYILSELKDPSTGEWFWRINPDGRWLPEDSLAGFWKCPYHNTRACLEGISRLSLT
ncbi:MAG: AGE family epimerase/isomerase [Bacteroidia bacterium]|nr:AGE family epimerase/isomerase [Bacteroidia bacterium]